MNSQQALEAYERHMRAAKRSPRTIGDRLELLVRLARWLAPRDLFEATPDDLERFQQSLAHLSRNSLDIYSRHVFAFYKWARDVDMVQSDLTRRMVRIQARRGVPHPISEADLRIILACSRGGLRLAYILAAFAGLRAGEITRLRGEDLTLDGGQSVALIHGKGDRERIVPLLPPVVAEIEPLARLQRRGVIVRMPNGTPYTPANLSVMSSRFMKELGVCSTLHSLRHYFATSVVKLTRDVLLVRDLLGHSSIATTQIYMHSSLDDAHQRLEAFSTGAGALISNN